MRFRLGSALVAVALLALSTVSALAQAFPNYPNVNGPALTDCLSYGNAGACSVYRPAGPTALTGNETVPADTNLTGGANPQTVRIPLPILGAGVTTYSVPLTGATSTLTPQTRQLIINPAGTIAAHTLQFPTATALAQYNGARFGFCTTQVVTALTVTAGSGTTVSNPPTAMLVPVATGAASCVEWIYVASVTTWFRTQ